MNKNIYDLLNDAEMNFSAYDHENLSEADKARLKKNFNKSIKNLG